jgi:hypothetical protein
VVDHNERFNRTLVVSTVLCCALIATTVLYLAANVTLNLLSGCPPGDVAWDGPEPNLSVIPPGVTCSYQLAGRDGTITVRPSAFPEVTILACTAFLIIIRRLRRSSD